VTAEDLGGDLSMPVSHVANLRWQRPSLLVAGLAKESHSAS